MRIKHIFLQNFCKFYGSNVVDTDLYGRTEVSGVNEAGKSTIKRAIQYIFGCRDENGREITGIRPHDKDGNDIDGDITAEVTVEIDGTERTIKKVCKKEYNKKGELKGNVTECYVDGISKKAKEFEQFLADFVTTKEIFSLCINANTLLSLNPTDQRLTLSQYFSQSDAEIAASIPEFAPLVKTLEVGNIKSLKSSLNKDLNDWKKKLDEVQARIDEVRSRRESMGLAELELQKKALYEKLEENKSKQNTRKSYMDGYYVLSDGVMALQFQLTDLQKKANEILEAQRADKRKALNMVQNENQKELLKADTIREEITELEKRIAQYEQKRQELKKSWDLNKSLKFDENSLICSYCGQEYPEEKKEQLRTEFDTHKAHELELITKEGSSCTEHIKADQAELEHKREELKKTEDEVERLEKEVSIADNALNSIPTSVDISGTEEYKSIRSQIAEREAAMNDYADLQTLMISLRGEEEQIQKEIYEVSHKIKSATDDDSRIDELEKNQREYAQKVTDVQAQLDLLKKFSRKKNEMLEADVNKYLSFCTVRMFRPLVNGDTEECCDFTYRGEPYSRNMNHGARILTEIDICNAFQKRCGVELPIMVDDTESLDPWKIPDVDSQLIMFRRSDDASLKVEEVANA